MPSHGLDTKMLTLVEFHIITILTSFGQQPRQLALDCNNKAWFLEGHENKNNIYTTMPGVLYSPSTSP